MPLFNPTVSEVTATIPILSSGGVAPDISIPQSDAITDGYLSSVDWVIFDSKGSGTVTGVSGTLPITSSGGATPVISTSIATNRLVGRGTAGVGEFEEIILGTNLSFTGTTLNATGGGGGGVASVTGTLPISSSGGANPDISIFQSGAITDGYLSSIDWVIFDSKGTSNFVGVTSTAPISTDNIDPNNPVLSIPQSDAITDGYLSSIDWNTFDSKGTSNFNQVTSTAPISTDNIDPNNPVLSIPQSDAITDGYLSSIDWNIFNSKGNGTVTNVTATSLITSSGGVAPDISTSMATNRLLGRGTAGVGIFEEIILGTNLSLTGTTLNASGGGGGTVTGVTATLPISSSGGATPDISITQSSAITNGYLSSIDWNTFNNKGSGTVTSVATAGLISGGPISTTGTITTLMATNRLVGRGTALSGVMEEIILGTNLSLTGTTLNATNSGGTVTGVTATLPISSSGGATPDISITQSGAITDGYLSSIDWNTFDSKGNGTVTNVTATSLITSSGGVTPDISTSIQTNKLVGRGTALTGVFEEITLGTNLTLLGTTLNASGGGTVTSVAALTLGTTGTNLSSTVANGTTTPVITLNVPDSSALNRGALTAADWTTFNNKGSGTVTSVSGTLNRITSSGGATPIIDISATYVGQTSITTLGTIGTGVWNGTTIAIANGGTGQVTATLAFDALSPTTTRGDTIVRGVTNNVRLALGTAGKILRSDGTDLVYTTATYPTTTAVSTLLYSSSANVIAALATANNGVLVTSATGVPSISAALTYVATTGVLTNTLSANASIQIAVTNTSSGVATVCQFTANNGTYNLALQQLGTSYTTNGLLVANQSRIASSSISSMLINTPAASVPIIFAVGGFTASNEVHRSTSSGIEFRVLLTTVVHSAANLMAGQITLVGGTLAIAITGLTTSHRGMVTLVTANNVLNTRSYQAVCTVNTITIRANTDTGLLNPVDTSVLNYFIFLNN